MSESEKFHPYLLSEILVTDSDGNAHVYTSDAADHP